MDEKILNCSLYSSFPFISIWKLNMLIILRCRIRWKYILHLPLYSSFFNKYVIGIVSVNIIKYSRLQVACSCKNWNKNSHRAPYWSLNVELAFFMRGSIPSLAEIWNRHDPSVAFTVNFQAFCCTCSTPFRSILFAADVLAIS